MAIRKASGQGSGGVGLLVTALTSATAQTLHTAVAGTASTELMGAYAVNNGDTAATLTLVFEPDDGSDPVVLTEVIPAKSGLYQLSNQGGDVALPLNDTMVVKAYASVAGQVVVWGLVGDQSGVGQQQVIQSGVITPVQNDVVYRTNGLAESDVESAHNLLIPVAGTLTNLRAKAPVTLVGGQTVTVTVRVDGVNTALSVPVAAAETTVIQLNSDSVAVTAGSLVTIKFACSNDVPDAADRLLASVDFVPSV